MGAMKISDGPRYKKTGTPLQKQHKKVQRIAALIFSELLPHTTQKIKNETLPLPPGKVETVTAFPQESYSSASTD
jgi:hypothetical protein